ncbi:phosphoribosyltransferase-like protein [Algoriphagus aquimarinus]|uniref:PRTase-CE domain-containing protein n=1 Tax=Algoriphagus aquimarinus TaxID=237018 RepID=A0A1I1BQL4_9BACT|nr:hypothetical protein [Algoriphagus aquimarinus]SFB50730.1 hypothetical protein SAMN04489723_114100 [Algoriphagus aquimarinus]
MPSNTRQYEETLQRSRFFQTIQAWPLDEELNYEGWLSNFSKEEEQVIACSILDFFVHYPARMVNKMLANSVANSGYFFLDYFPDWEHSNFKDRCFYSFIPGESQHPTDSGNLFTRKLRDELLIPEDKIISYQDIRSIPPKSPIIFVDDFVGSGSQVYKAWNVNQLSNGKTLKEYVHSAGHCAVYSPLIVNYKGNSVMKTHCPTLNLSATHVLGPEYNLFDKTCFCWKNDSELFSKGISLILSKSKLLGIPSTEGDDTRDEKGFDRQGLAISFEHGAPDAIPSFFYWKTDNWTPLLRKHYER